jgi:hypothetical protein
VIPARGEKANRVADLELAAHLYAVRPVSALSVLAGRAQSGHAVAAASGVLCATEPKRG